MDEEIQYLRKKVKQLEEMMIKMNDKIGHILDEFLHHKANQAAGLQLIFQDDADMCLSLMSQFKSYENSGISSNPNSTRPRKRPIRNKGPVVQPQFRDTKRRIERPQIQPRDKAQESDFESQPQADDADDFDEIDSNFDGSSEIQLETIPEVILSDATNDSKRPKSSISSDVCVIKTEPLEGEPEQVFGTTYDPELDDEVEDDPNDSDDGTKRHRQSRHRRSGEADAQHKRNYKFIKKFSNITEALKFVKNENLWTKNRNRKSKEGLIMYYRCKFGGRNGKCPATMHLRQVPGSDQFEFFISKDTEHQHTAMNDLTLEPKTT